MLRTPFLVAALCAPLLLAQAPSLDQVLGKHYGARGGLAKIKAVKSSRVTAKMAMGPMEIPMVIESKRPASIRIDVTVQGLTITTAYDGKAGWSVNPMQSAKKEAEPMTAEQLKDMENQADPDGPLVDWKAKGHKLELQGTEPVEGSPAFKLKLTLKNGNETTIYLDTDSYLDVKHVAKRKVRDTEIEAETIYGDYKEVGGMMVAHSIESGAKGNPQKQKITLEKMELNPAIEDARFAMPAAPPVTAPAKKDEPKK